ncbi:hypothetical protein [Nonlabens sp. Asnod2-A12]|uniref:hypothetical protein n=1 Tax=Nonlabens sp. Asnod2-A12 TaxID=3160578 RepID=UPI003866D709
MNEEIYISDSFGDFNVVVEGDEHSLWAYVFENVNEEYQILCDGFICSRGLIVQSNEDVKTYIEKGSQPPLMEEYASTVAVQENLSPTDISISINMVEIIVEVKNIPFLKIDFEHLKPYSKAVSKDGPYGFAWREEI